MTTKKIIKSAIREALEENESVWNEDTANSASLIADKNGVNVNATDYANRVWYESIPAKTETYAEFSSNYVESN